MKIVSAAEMGEIDRVTSEKFGVPSTTLMENAGMAVADFCAAQYPRVERVSVISGRGNNGGDGFVAAEALRDTVGQISVVILAKDASELSADAAAMCSRLQVEPIWIGYSSLLGPAPTPLSYFSSPKRA